MNRGFKLRDLTKIAVLSAIAMVLFQFSFPLPIFPFFLKFDISDLPGLLAGFAMGPVQGVAVVLIKNLLHLLQTKTGGIGELSNFLSGAVMILTSAMIYKKHKNIKYAVLGLVFGSVLATITQAFVNYYVMIPFYTKFMPIDAIVNKSAAVNSLIKDKFTLILYGIVPFNLVKMAGTSLVTFLLYKRISPILKK